MKKKLLMLGAALAISAVSAQAVFAAKPDSATENRATLVATDAKLDLSNVKVGKAVAIGKVKGTYKGKTLPSTAKANGAVTIETTESQLDWSKVKEGKAEAIGPVSGNFEGSKTTAAKK
ncbi:hypothetical protein [Cohnella abietis]|uniref:Uncharacterized protein n=1 Tax=Cohnella abietis TaxID=2507935 RepID=A0A3T1DEE8_9BACL|nr:hypothetical protein [Cohnella abietis]BBI36472.1 hypothetical protein KCTCHS21_58710 [Cohnella abietis]